MRVLRVVPSISSESGGPVRSTLGNCRALQAVAPSIQFTLATTAEGLTPKWQEDVEARMPPGAKLKVFPVLGRHTLMISPRLLLWLWRRAGDFDLLVVQALLHPVSSVTAWIARRRDVPYLVIPHGTLSSYTFEHRRTLLKRAYVRIVERRTLSGAAAIRFTSDAERREARWDAVPESRVIPHPYEPRFSSAEPAGTHDTNSRQILFLARLHPVKGISLLLKAFQLVLAEISAASLVLAGSGARGFERKLKLEIRRLGLGHVVKLPGFVEGEEKRRLLEESTIFALPSLHENFGMAAVEAMDAGLPVVISRGVALWHRVQAAEAGIVIEERTPLSVAEAILRLLDDERLRREMGSHGQELIRSVFAPEAVGEELIGLYETVADGGAVG